MASLPIITRHHTHGGRGAGSAHDLESSLSASCKLFVTTLYDLQQQYEHFHTRLKRLRDELGIPYLYVEWQQGLAAISGPFLQNKIESQPDRRRRTATHLAARPVTGKVVRTICEIAIEVRCPYDCLV